MDRFQILPNVRNEKTPTQEREVAPEEQSRGAVHGVAKAAQPAAKRAELDALLQEASGIQPSTTTTWPSKRGGGWARRFLLNDK